MLRRSVAAAWRHRQPCIVAPRAGYASGRATHDLLSRGRDDAPLVARTQEEMEQLGARVAAICRRGDVIFLKGYTLLGWVRYSSLYDKKLVVLWLCIVYRDLGCGKTCFARGFIRERTQDAAMQVTSPTYLLINTYEQPESTCIYHVDLYRLDSVSEQDMAALGLADAFVNGISLVEWSERLDEASVPSERLDVQITYDDDGDDSVRYVSLHPFGLRWTSESAH
ncbi:Yjee family atpase, partial [Globisporangium splendens]